MMHNANCGSSPQIHTYITASTWKQNPTLQITAEDPIHKSEDAIFNMILMEKLQPEAIQICAALMLLSVLL